MEATTPHCLFCKEKLERPPFQSQDDGTLTRVKGSLFPSGDHDYSIPPVEDIPLVFSDEGEDSLVHDHLKTFFVLKGILKIRDEVLSELLGLCDGRSRPENWVNICWDCGKLVRKFYEDLKHICTLERRLIRTEWVLREKIIKSRGKEGGNDPISERIRGEAMQVYDDNDNPSGRGTLNLDENSFHMDGPEEEYAVPSPSSSFVPDSPSKPFEFWDSEEENEDDQRQSIEKTETNKDSKDAHVEDEEEEEDETDGEEPPQPIFVDLVSDDEDGDNEKDKATQPPPSQAQVKITTDPKLKTSVRNGDALTNSTQKTESTTQKDTSSNKNVAQKGPTSQKGAKGIVKHTRSIETQTLRTAQDRLRNTNNQVAPNPTQVSSNLSVLPSEASQNFTTKVSNTFTKTSATVTVYVDQESDVSSDNRIEIESLNFGEIDDFQKFCNETNYGSDCELELEEVMWRAEQTNLPPPTTMREHLPYFDIVQENHDISELEAAQNGIEGNLEMLRIPDPNNPYYGLICPPECGFVYEAPPPPPVHFCLKTFEPQPVPFELQQNERISSSSPAPVLTPPNSSISSSHSSYDNATNLNLLAMVTETARINGEHPTPPNSTTQELQVELESPCSELRIEINETSADIDSSATTSALNTPMCLSSSDEEDSRKEIRAVNGKRKQIFVKNGDTTTAPVRRNGRLKIHDATPCPDTTCGLLVLRNSLAEHLRTHENPTRPPPPPPRRKLTRKKNPPILKAVHNNSQGYKTFKRMGNKIGYKCLSCPASFVYLNAMKSHLQLHVPGSKVKICGEKHCGWFVAPDDMLGHRSKHHPDLKFKCNTCHAIYFSNSGLFKHERLHERGEGSICDQCGWLVKNMKFHSTKWHPQNPVSEMDLEEESSCSSFSDSEQSEINLISDDENESSDDEGPPHLEPEVDLAPTSGSSRKRKNLSELNPHSTTDYISRLDVFGKSNRKYYYCQKCPYFSCHLSSINHHLLCHKPGMESIVCEVCKWYVDPRRFKDHLVRRHPDLYTSQNQLKKQKRQSHTTSASTDVISETTTQPPVANRNPENNFICPECSSFFLTLSAYEEHQRVHSGDGRLACEACGWMTKNLARHRLKWHPSLSPNNESGYVSLPSPPPPPQEEVEEEEDDDDGGGTISVVSLNQRNRDRMRNLDNSNPLYITFIVDGKKVFKCRQCGTRMRRLDLLKSHLKIHGGIRRSLRIKNKKIAPKANSEKQREPPSPPPPAPPKKTNAKAPLTPQQSDEDDPTSHPLFSSIISDGRKMYQCRRCSAKVRKLTLFKTHLKTHDEEEALGEEIREKRRRMKNSKYN